MVDIDFTEEDEVQKGEFSIGEIILRHIRKISDLCCKEFTGGYWDKRPVTTSSGVMFVERYHEDVREAYCNAINFLRDVIYPKGDEKLREYIDGKDSDPEDIKQKVLVKRKMFQEINMMFERTNFWQRNDISNE